MAGEAMGEARAVIRDRFGEPYTMPKGRVYKTKSKGAQEAHESIRPTSFKRDPDALAKFLKPEELRLYRLIWQRALASQMEAKELETTTAELAAAPYELRATATRTLFDGFARVYTEGRDENAADEDAEGRLPALAEGDETTVRDITTTQHFTEPPPRFTEASLIKALEELGIGRPSTYAATISTIVDRGYVRIEERRLHPEQVAGIVIDLLVEHFGDYVDFQFTAKMEEDLDEVANGTRAWVPLLEAFYAPLKLRVDEKRRELKRRDFTTEATDEVCSLGHPMVIRLGRNGRFLACSLYPEHKESRPLPGDEAPPQAGEGETCPQCGEGTLVGKRGRFGPFVGCDRYPDCDYIRREGPRAAGAAAVRGRLPEERRRQAPGASRPANRQRLLGMLELPEVRLHDEPRADRGAPRDRRRAGREEGRCVPVPEMRRGDRGAERRARRSGCACRAGRPIPRPSRRHGARAGGPAAGAPAAARSGTGTRAPRRGGRSTRAAART